MSKKENAIQKKLEPPQKTFFTFSVNLREVAETYLIARIRHLLIGYFGDAIFYMSDTSKKVKSQLENVILQIAKDDADARISIVAHSMGSVIAFDLLTDASFQRKIRKIKISIENLFTVGSPLALFLLRPEKKRGKKLPIGRKWLNIYDKRDVIASRLNPFFSQCRDYQIKVQDSNALNTHMRYFRDPEVLNRILRSM